MTDPIADYLTRLRNAIQAKHRVVEVPASNLKKEITKILFEKGYILNYKFVEDGPQGTIKVALKYDPVNKVNAIKKLERISSPGLRQYTGYKDMPRVINGGFRKTPEHPPDAEGARRGSCRENRSQYSFPHSAHPPLTSRRRCTASTPTACIARAAANSSIPGRLSKNGARNPGLISEKMPTSTKGMMVTMRADNFA